MGRFSAAWLLPTTTRNIGWTHRTVATWLTHVAATGLTISQVTEPAGAIAGRPDGGGPWCLTPRFLAFAAFRA